MSTHKGTSKSAGQGATKGRADLSVSEYGARCETVIEIAPCAIFFGRAALAAIRYFGRSMSAHTHNPNVDAVAFETRIKLTQCQSASVQGTRCCGLRPNGGWRSYPMFDIAHSHHRTVRAYLVLLSLLERSTLASPCFVCFLPLFTFFHTKIEPS